MTRFTDRTREWKGPYAPYDLVKELFIALGVMTLLAVVLTIMFSSPDDKPSTIAQWSTTMPADFVTTAVGELDGTSKTAEYGPPYNHAAEGQHAAFLKPQEWLGVSHPIDTPNAYVFEPLQSVPNDPAARHAIVAFRAAPPKQQTEWAEAYAKALEKATVQANGTLKVPSGEYGPVPAMMDALLGLAQTGGLEGDLLKSNQFFRTDFTKPLLLMADGKLLEERANAQHLLGNQWGMMNETGSYPGQSWLWLYTFWYQVEPFKASSNADLLVILVMTVLSLAFILIPFIPGIRSIPRWIPVHRLIWREHYRASGVGAEARRADG
ncbi:MAG TPA: hypothetical protein VK672_03075 [Solirubrobacteraceae bacterium]|jgi:hypothetical protein|nr:hypothetical protein [Solirubrobacteraceae bacterium]